MRNEESEFSSLRTVSTFDRGENCTLAVDVTTQEIQQFSPSSLLVESLIEQLCKLMDQDPHNQKKLYLAVCEKLYQMNLISESYVREEFQFIRSHYQKALYRLLTVAQTTSVENNALFPKNSSQLALSASCGSVLEWSRYCTEFQELEYIAKGGFGNVYKAQHKLDGEIYAVKKIILRYKSVNDFLQNLREVKMLAKLNHPNIVAYKAAWLEPLDEPRNNRKIKENKVPALLDKTFNSSDIFDNTQEEKDGSLEVVFEGSGHSVSVIDESEPMSCTSSNNSVSIVSMPVDKVVYQKEVYQFNCRKESRFTSTNQSAILFIQMQLCQRTLRNWLDQRNQVINSDINVDQCVEIFKKIVKGVEYIHSQGIVHHDIKPSNIFVNEDLSEVQVGDFGLACSLLAHSSGTLPIFTTHPRGEIGTRLYAAPEQLKGICNPKSDVYSLGIVLLELLQPFSTTMERTEVIEQLRSGQIPTQLTASYPNLAKIISETVTSLRQRPTSSELYKSVEEAQNVNTVTLVEQQNQLIQQLRRESKAKDEEIASLKKKLEELLAKENGMSLP